MDTESWLTELDLAQYLQAFTENDLDWETLPSLDDSDLKEIGVKSLGHRKKLLLAISALQPAEERTPASTPSPAAGSAAGSDSERRQVSVMFCDLVGSTELSTRLDAEDVDALIRAYQEAMTPIIHEFQGHVARFAGDGILSYFGYPHAIEFEAESAVRAAIKAVTVAQRTAFHPGIESQVRIGIATGDVVIGGLFDQGNLYEAMATGETPNLAARLQGLAQPGGIVVCDVTRQLAGQLIYFDDMGMSQLKGFDRQKRSWLVTGKSESRDRFWAGKSQQDWSSLAGRQAEISSLMSGWRRAQGARGGSVLITGDAGVGKSRLFSVLLDTITESERVHMRIVCEQYYRNTPLYPFIHFFNTTLGTSPEDSADHRKAQLERYLQDFHAQPETVIPFVARMLDIPGYEDHPALLGMSPQRIREKTMEVGVSLLQYGAQTMPFLISVEDLHWADPTTLEFLERLASTISTQPIYLVMTARPESVLGWSAVTPKILHLSKLSPEQIQGIVQELAGDREFPEKIVAQICERSDGIPLYAEELTRSLLLQMDEAEQNNTGLPDFSVPNALQSGLLARLDKLSGIKEFALQCSVIGQEFTCELACMVSNTGVAEAEDALGGLVAAEIIDIQPGLSPARYVFRHVLLRDAAYGHLLRARRRELHLRLAGAFETHFPNTVSNEPELLAHHYTSAAAYPKAINYWLKAGQRALAASANIEAAEHLQNGLALLQHLADDDPLRVGLELQMQMTLAPALIAVKGFAAPEVKTSFSRSRALCDSMGASEPLFPAMRGLMSFYSVQADYQSAIDIGRELQTVVAETDNQGHKLELAWVLGSASLFSGQLSRAMALFEQAIPLYSPEDHAGHAVIYGQDPGVATLTHYLVGLNFQGRYDEAVAVEAKVTQLTEQLKHPFTQAQAAGFLQSSLFLKGDHEALRTLSADNLAFCQQQGFPVFMALSMIYGGWCKCVDGDSSGIDDTKSGIDIYAMSGAETGSIGFILTLVECYLLLSQPEKALDAIEQSMQRAAQIGELIFFPAQLETKARILALLDFAKNYHPARELLLESVLSSQKLGAKHYELVALTGLVQLLRKAGEDDNQATEDLRSLYQSQGQGLRSKPMRAAQALLH